MIQALSPNELEKSISELRELFPDRDIKQAYPSSYACDMWGKNFEGIPGSTSRNKHNGKPVDLETEINVFHSIYDWKCGDAPLTVIKYKPDDYQIWVEKKSKREEGIKEEQDERKEIAKSFFQVGVKPNLNIQNSVGCRLVPKEERKEYWQSESIWHPEVSVNKMQAYRTNDLKGGVELFMNPGYYSSSQLESGYHQNLENMLLLKMELNPIDYDGLYGNCKICRGEKYKGHDKVKFLVASEGHEKHPLSCEFCFDEYLTQLSDAFKQSAVGPSDFNSHN